MTELTIAEEVKKVRIEKELEDAGVIYRHMHPFTNNYLPHVIHDTEHIKAAVFGRRKESEGFFGFVEGILIATNERIIFLDHRPGYTTMDELSYDVVSGVHLATTFTQASITLYTKIANYSMSFASHASAEKFVAYIESAVIDRAEEPLPNNTPAYRAIITGEALDFLKKHEVGVLSSVERTGSLTGAVVYYTMLDGYSYFMTQASSRKADNLLGNQHVALTVFDEPALQTIQISGIVETVEDDALKSNLVTSIAHARTYADGSHTPPILRTSPVDIQVYKIIPTTFHFTDYSSL